MTPALHKAAGIREVEFAANTHDGKYQGWLYPRRAQIDGETTAAVVTGKPLCIGPKAESPEAAIWLAIRKLDSMRGEQYDDVPEHFQEAAPPAEPVNETASSAVAAVAVAAKKTK